MNLRSWMSYLIPLHISFLNYLIFFLWKTFNTSMVIGGSRIIGKYTKQWTATLTKLTLIPIENLLKKKKKRRWIKLLRRREDSLLEKSKGLKQMGKGRMWHILQALCQGKAVEGDCEYSSLQRACKTKQTNLNITLLLISNLQYHEERVSVTWPLLHNSSVKYCALFPTAVKQLRYFHESNSDAWTGGFGKCSSQGCCVRKRGTV